MFLVPGSPGWGMDDLVLDVKLVEGPLTTRSVSNSCGVPSEVVCHVRVTRNQYNNSRFEVDGKVRTFSDSVNR